METENLNKLMVYLNHPMREPEIKSISDGQDGIWVFDKIFREAWGELRKIDQLSKAPEEGEENLGMPKLMDVYRRVQNKSTYIVTGINPDTEEVRIDGTAYSLTQFHANFKKD